MNATLLPPPEILPNTAREGLSLVRELVGQAGLMAGSAVKLAVPPAEQQGWERELRRPFLGSAGQESEPSGSPEELTGCAKQLSALAGQLSALAVEFYFRARKSSGSAVEFFFPARKLSGSTVEFFISVRQLSGSTVQFFFPARQLSGSAVGFFFPAREFFSSGVEFFFPARQLSGSALQFFFPVVELSDLSAEFTGSQRHLSHGPRQDVAELGAGMLIPLPPGERLGEGSARVGGSAPFVLRDFHSSPQPSPLGREGVGMPSFHRRVG